MHIRPATLHDAKAIARVQVRCWHTAYRGIVPDAYLARFTLEARTNRWLANLAEAKRMETVVAEEDETVLGWAGYGENESDLAPDVGELGGLYVDPEGWGRGTGSALLARAEQALRNAGFREAVLWTLAENTPTRRFYEARGWRHDGTESLHRSGAPVLRYIKSLTAGVDPGIGQE